MITRIHQLPPIIANQIAAGEVVERPASVVKELLENSLDAQSTQIEIIIAKGGTNSIRITDNGSGIEKADLALALSRHATSKIFTLDDLTGVTSLGFRGEALASIASVSQLILTSAVDQTAWKICVEGEQQQPEITAAAHPRGTTIEVANLFFNTPVRRKFLRGDRTEFTHVEDVVKRAALSHFNVAFKFIADDREVFNLPPALTKIEQEKRVAKLCSKAFLATSIFLQQQAEGLQLSGWLCSPEHSRAHSDLQYFFLNGRMIRDKVINHALRSAAQEFIPDGRYLAYVLYLQCDPKTVDVNVHPTKHEVRFQQSRLIHDFINSSVSKLFSVTDEQETVQEFEQADLYVRESLASYSVTKKANFTETVGKFGKAIAQVKQHYVIAENDQGLVIIDLRVARQHLFQQQLQQSLVTQPLLMPKTICLQPAQIEKLLSMSLEKFAIELQQNAADTIIVRSVPNMLKDVNLEELIKQLLQTNQPTNCIASIAAASSRPMSLDVLQTLLHQLEQISLPTNCWRVISL